tara:strand:+ start:491 stop:1162 length:672 start_codon:yes stop_codon:yes gene_type:complete
MAKSKKSKKREKSKTVADKQAPLCSAYVNEKGELIVEVPGEPSIQLPSHLTPWTPFEKIEFTADSAPGETVVEGVYRNSRYEVTRYEGVPMVGSDMKLSWLSVVRLDKQPVFDWRDLQRIKNELLGPEREAVDLFPSEARLVDTGNTYHIWAFPQGTSLPFGFLERLVAGEQGDGVTSKPMSTDAESSFKDHQRTFEELPEDAANGDDMIEYLTSRKSGNPDE